MTYDLSEKMAELSQTVFMFQVVNPSRAMSMINYFTYVCKYTYICKNTLKLTTKYS